MSGRGWRRWKSGGLYAGGGCKHGVKKHSRTYSEEFLVGCGRQPLLLEGRGAKARRLQQLRREKERRITRSNGDLDGKDVDDEADEGSILWLDQRSRLPPSLGWYSSGMEGLLESFKKSSEEREREKSLEESFENHFEKGSKNGNCAEPRGSAKNSNGFEEDEIGLSHYEDVSFDIGNERDFDEDAPEPSRLTPLSDVEMDSGGDSLRQTTAPNHRKNSDERRPSTSSSKPRSTNAQFKLEQEPKRSIKPWDHQLWTSRDLRRYLVLKASEKLGGPSVSEICSLPRKDEATDTPEERLQRSKPSSTTLGVKQQETGKIKTKTIFQTSNFAPKEMILLRGGTLSIREQPQRSSLKIPRPTPPPLRHRHWSLPAIIVTHSEDLSPPRDAFPSPPASPSTSSSSISMKYLQVPSSFSHPRASAFPRRAYSLKERSLSTKKGDIPHDLRFSTGHHKRRSLYNGDISDADITSEEDLSSVHSERRPSQLESLLSLICDSSEEDPDEGWDRDRGRGRAGSPPPDKRPAVQHVMDYEEALMYGRYSANLAEYARQEAKRVREEERQTDEFLFSKELQPYRGRVARGFFKFIRPIWDNTFARLGEDWVFLFFLGTTMATLSFVTDYIVYICFKARMYLHDDLLHDIHWTLQLFAWVTIPTLLVIFSAAFCQWLAPSAAGSGIPEMKTILRGVILKEYLTWKTLVAKLVGLATVIGAGLPLGKEGPVMHMASIVSTMLMNLLKAIKGVVDNEAHSTDLLAAASTMGVAVCYAAPIGGVLFSIEVTTVYFAVRNYWRGFFAAVVGAMFYRLMHVWFMNEETIYPIYKVEHNFRFPYDVIELLPFLCIGIFCGFAGSLFVYLHRRYVIFVRQNKTVKKLLNKKRLLYPTFVAILIAVSTFPGVLGNFMASRVTTKQQILDLFSNVTWTHNPNQEPSFDLVKILEHWVSNVYPNFHLSLFIFQIVTVFEIAIASTLPVPNGILIPLLKVGAAFGRQIGELMVYLYPLGLQAGYPIIPGAYAMVGAASFCAAITHTISISVIVFELTGQITYVIPIMIGVLISNCISSLLQPSIYDSVIRIKKLPYLPDIITTTSDVYNIFVDDIMVREVKYIWYGITYMDLKNVVKENRKLKYFPIVDKHDSMILLGSIPRIELVRLLVDQISSDKRRKEAKKRYLEALKKRWEEEDLRGLPINSKIRYEDEMNTTDEEDEDITTKEIFRKLSRTLSRSLSRSSRSLSRSLSRSQSQSTSRHHSPDRENESGSEEEEEEESQNDLAESDSETSTPPQSPAASKLKDLFPLKSSFERKGSNLSVEKESNDAEGPQTQDGEPADRDQDTDEAKDSRSKETDAGDKTSSGEEPSPKKKSPFDILKGTRQKMAVKKSSGGLPSAKAKLRLTRSNSLDSLRTRSSNLKDSLVDGIKGSTKQIPPKKGILKRRNSLSLGSLNTIGLNTTDDSNYQTVTVVDTKLRNAFEKIRKLKGAGSSMEFKFSQISLFKSKKKDQAKKKALDMSEEEREVWELRELSKEVDFTKCHIDPAPFQLVERTSLLRVHSLFSMLGINHAYVTAIGRLIGVVSLKEVRHAIEGQYMGKGNPPQNSIKVKTSPSETNLGSGTSPQQMGHLSSIPSLDPEAGTVIRRSVSSNHLVAPVANGYGGR